MNFCAVTFPMPRISREEPSNWRSKSGSLDPATEIVTYCGAGNRSALSAENLQRMGYKNVRSLAGGLQAWIDAGLPTWRGRHSIED